MKRTYPKSIAEIIDEAVAMTGDPGLIAEQRACYLWTEVVGPGVNRYTSRRYVEHGVLHVYITSAVLKNELSFHRTGIVKAINDAVGTEVLTSLVIH